MYYLTGGSGLVGTYVLAELMRNKVEVKCLIRSKESELVMLETVATLLGKHTNEFQHLIETINGEVEDYYTVEGSISEGDVVIHAAAAVSFDSRQRTVIFDTNIEGTRNVVNACLHKKAERLIYVSSVAAIGRTPHLEWVTEETPWQDSSSNTLYAISKYHAELEVWRAMEEGLKAVIVNPTIVLGYTLRGNSSSSIFHQIKKGFPFTSEGINGFVGAKDIASSVLKLIDENVTGERFILNSENLSYDHLFSLTAQGLNKPEPRFYVNQWMKWIILPLAYILSIVSRKPPFVTKEVFATSLAEHKYSADKIKERIGFDFTPVRQVVEEITQLMS